MDIEFDKALVGKKYKLEVDGLVRAVVMVQGGYHIPKDFMTLSLSVEKAYLGCEDGDLLRIGKSLNPRLEEVYAHIRLMTIGSEFRENQEN